MIPQGARRLNLLSSSSACRLCSKSHSPLSVVCERLLACRAPVGLAPCMTHMCDFKNNTHEHMSSCQQPYLLDINHTGSQGAFKGTYRWRLDIFAALVRAKMTKETRAPSSRIITNMKWQSCSRRPISIVQGWVCTAQTYQLQLTLNRRVPVFLP